jgi:phosphoribosylformimino-5-aminoimidazole carboxamide ribonucleotide (ProFAR) isomerase
MSFRFVRERAAKIPKIILEQEDYEKIGKLIIASITRNIGSQKQADGSSLKQNSPQTSLAKMKAGLPTMSLIAWGRRLVAGIGAAFISEIDKRSVTVYPSPVATKGWRAKTSMSPKDLTKYVQQKGYVGWFGLDKQSREDISTVLEVAIRKAFK